VQQKSLFLSNAHLTIECQVPKLDLEYGNEVATHFGRTNVFSPIIFQLGFLQSQCSMSAGLSHRQMVTLGMQVQGLIPCIQERTW